MKRSLLLAIGILLILPFAASSQNYSLWRYIGNLRPVVNSWRVDAPGGLSGGTLTVSSLKSCNTIDTNGNGVFSCGTDEGSSGGFGTGNVITINNATDNSTSTGHLISNFKNIFLASSTGALRTAFNSQYLSSSTGSLKTSFGFQFVQSSTGSLRSGLFGFGQGLSKTAGGLVTLNSTLTGSLAKFTTLSGSAVYGKTSLASSGSLAWETSASGASLWVSTFEGSGLVDCDVSGTSKLLWDATSKRFSCGTDTDTDTNTTYTAAQGLTLNGTAFRLNSTISGSLVNFTTVSGSSLYAKNSIASSGSLAWETSASGASIWVSTFDGAGLVDCDADAQALSWDTTAKKFVCGDDDSAAGISGAGQGLTLIGTTALRLSDSFSGTTLEIMGVSSGRVLHAQDTLRSSGSLSVQGATLLKGSVTFSNLPSCTVLQSNTNGAISCAGGALFSSTGSIKANFGSQFVQSSTGALRVVFDSRYLANSTGGLRTAFGFQFVQSSTGSLQTRFDGKYLQSSTGSLRTSLYTAGQGLTKNGGLFYLNSTNSGSLSNYTTQSGSKVYAKDSLASSGSLAWETSASGASIWVSTFDGSGLTDCDGDTQALAWDTTTKKFSCGDDDTSASPYFSTGNVITIVSSTALTSSTGSLKTNFGSQFVQSSTGALRSVFDSRYLANSTGGLRTAFGFQFVQSSTGSLRNTLFTAGQGLTKNGGLFTLNASNSGSLSSYTTQSGSKVFAKNELLSSGSLVVKGTTIHQSTNLTRGTMTGWHLYAGTMSGAGLSDCDNAANSKLLWDATNSVFSCGTDSTAAGGADLSMAFADTRYVRVQGDTMTGGLLIVNGGAGAQTIDSGLLLEVAGSASGRTIHAQDLLNSSGALAVEGKSYFYDTGFFTTMSGTDVLMKTAKMVHSSPTPAAVAGQTQAYSRTGSGNDLNTTFMLYSNDPDTSVVFTDSAVGASETHRIQVVGGAKHSTTREKYGQSSVSCTSSPGLLINNGNATADFSFTDSDFTVDFWVNVTTNTSVNRWLIGEGSAFTDNSYQWMVGINSSNQFFAQIDGATTLTLTDTTTIWVGDQWLHIALVRDGISSAKLYVDGAEVASGIPPIANTPGSSWGLGICRPRNAANTYFANGYIDDIRISKIERWTAAFKPKGSAYTSEGLYIKKSDGTEVALEQATAAVGGGGSQWVESGSSIYYAVGNVGIGTENPRTALEVIGTISGSTIQASGTLSSSGILILQGDATLRGASSGAILKIGGANVTISNTSFVFNENSLDADFRIESDGNVNMFFVDASTNRIGIGTNVPETTLEVLGTISGSNVISLAAVSPSNYSRQVFASGSSIGAGTGKSLFTIPRSMTGFILANAYAAVDTTGTTGMMTVDVKNKTKGRNFFTKPIQIGSARTGSGTEFLGGGGVINAANDDVGGNDIIQINVPRIHTTAAKGLVVTLTFIKP